MTSNALVLYPNVEAIFLVLAVLDGLVGCTICDKRSRTLERQHGATFTGCPQLLLNGQALHL